MIKSMTGFGRGEYTDDNYNLKIEIKAVNHRYNDISVKMPRHMNYLEENIKKIIKDNISRGKIDIYLNLEYLDASLIDIKVDMNLAKSYKEALEKISEELDLDGNIIINNILSLSDIIKTERKEIDEEEILEVVQNSLKLAIADIMTMKIREGRELELDMVSHLEEIETVLYKIEERSPLVVIEYREKLKTRINELLENNLNIDEEKLNYEVAYFADKSNINEEIIRLKSHIGQFKDILAKEDIVGRKLDFLIQEMNREINTIGSKASDIEISSTVVDIKAEIEKIREQVQNVE